MEQRQGICRRNIQPKVTEIRSRIARVLDGDGIRRIVFAIPESRQAEDPFAVRAGGISTKGNRKQFEGAFLLLESETVNAPEDLISAERCREDRGRRGNCIGGRERIEAGLSVDIEIQVQMPHRGDAIFGPLCLSERSGLAATQILAPQTTTTNLRDAMCASGQEQSKTAACRAKLTEIIHRV